MMEVTNGEDWEIGVCIRFDAIDQLVCSCGDMVKFVCTYVEHVGEVGY